MAKRRIQDCIERLRQLEGRVDFDRYLVDDLLPAVHDLPVGAELGHELGAALHGEVGLEGVRKALALLERRAPTVDRSPLEGWRREAEEILAEAGSIFRKAGADSDAESFQYFLESGHLESARGILEPYGRKGPVLLLWGIPAVLLAAGALLTVHGVKHAGRAEASASWPSTEGEVRSVSIQKHYRGGTSSTPSGPAKGGGGTGPSSTSYSLQLRYTYEVGGRGYTGERFSFGGSPTADTEAQASALASRYPVGKKVRVYYDPKQPSSAVLVPGAEGGGYTRALLGGGLVLMALFTFFVVRSKS